MAASAGTIIDKNTTQENPVTNTNAATESLCPKGWTLPTTKQIDSNRAVSSFNPVLGGNFLSGLPYAESSRGYWWGSEASNVGLRYYLAYSSYLYTEPTLSLRGFYIRCVSEEKTATDLTYMQDMAFDS